MMEETLELQIDTCLEQTAAPRHVRVTGNGGVEIFSATMREPVFGEYLELWRDVDLEDSLGSNASLVAMLVSEWSEGFPVSAENVRKLHPAIQQFLMRHANEISTIKVAQIKNSGPLSTQTPTQPSDEQAA